MSPNVDEYQVLLIKGISNAHPFDVPLKSATVL